jgi:hypothetical protein
MFVIFTSVRSVPALRKQLHQPGARAVEVAEEQVLLVVSALPT